MKGGGDSEVELRQEVTVDAGEDLEEVGIGVIFRGTTFIGSETFMLTRSVAFAHLKKEVISVVQPVPFVLSLLFF
jgi:hypothetical protein